MAQPQRTQKGIAERFKGNLDYYKKAHYLRRGKFLVTLAVLGGGLAAMLAWHFFGGEKFYSSGSVTRPHAQFASDCSKCHTGGNTLEQTQLSFRDHAPLARSAMDAACLKCHQGFAFHEPNVVQNHACVACHHEHTGRGPMAPPENRNCLVCHGDSAIMQASLAKGKTLPAADFDFHRRAAAGAEVFHAPRPARGHTQVFTTFAGDHPEFQFAAERLRDPNPLKFNHQLHLTSPNIPLVAGKKLDCAACHQPDAAGAFYRKVSFAAHCQTCHSLQFDVENPELRLPHGNAEFVRAFLRSLPAQYAEHAQRAKHLTTTDDVNTFVQQQLARLRAEYGSGEQLERTLFLSDARTGPAARVAGLDATARARFPGCAYCHDVTARGATAEIAQPVQPDRWLIRSDFNHAKHTQIACEKCHAVRGSKDTADILLPPKANCASCHSPQGKAPDNCAECHRYHAKK